MSTSMEEENDTSDRFDDAQGAMPMEEERASPPPQVAAAPALDKAAAAAEAKEKGNELYKKKDYHRAIDLYSTAIELNPSDAAYHNNRCAAYMMLHDFELAARDAQSAVSLDPVNPKYHVRAAKCYVGLWRLGDAQRHIGEALRMDPKNADVVKDSKSLQDHLALEKNIADSFALSHFNNAISLLDRALQVAPGNAALQLRQAEAHVRMRQLEQAESIAVSVLRRHKNNVGALYWRGVVLQQRGEMEEAIKHFQSALRLDPDHEPSARQLKVARQLQRTKEEGNTAYKDGRLDEAMAAYMKSLELDPGNDSWNSRLRLNCAIVRAKKGDLKAAIQDCSIAIQLDSKYQKALTKRAQLYMQTEQYEDAVRDYDALKDLDPSNREIRQALKQAQLELKKSKRVDYYKVLEVAKDADEQTIQKSYRRLARIWHPDRHHEEEAKKNADTKFKQIGEAYAVLSDQRKRRQYDSGQDLEDMGGGGGGGFDHSDILAQMFGGGMRGGFGGGHGGGRGGFPFGGGFGGFHHGHGHGHEEEEDDDGY